MPPSQQAFISDYTIQIDARTPIHVFKYSVTLIILDVGRHTLKISVPDFGRGTSSAVDILE